MVPLVISTTFDSPNINASYQDIVDAVKDGRFVMMYMAESPLYLQLWGSYNENEYYVEFVGYPGNITFWAPSKTDNLMNSFYES